MPAQTKGASVPQYTEGDTAPSLRACLKDGKGDPIDLSGAGVVINIAFVMPRATYYTSPRNRIVENGPCIVDPDQVENMGFVDWWPQPGDLSPPGEYLYQFGVTYQDGTYQTVAVNYDPLKVWSPVGGLGI